MKDIFEMPLKYHDREMQLIGGGEEGEEEGKISEHKLKTSIPSSQHKEVLNLSQYTVLNVEVRNSSALSYITDSCP